MRHRSCTAPGNKCLTEFQSLAGELLSASSSLRQDSRGVFTLIELAEKTIRKKNTLCFLCLLKFINAATRGREMFWRLLPNTLGLPEWEVLQGQTRVPESPHPVTGPSDRDVDIILLHTPGPAQAPTTLTVMTFHVLCGAQLKLLGAIPEPARSHQWSVFILACSLYALSLTPL